MKPSIYQQAVYDFIKDGSGNAVINAVAGSGKSTTIVGALRLIPTQLKTAFLAFNKKIVNELVIKINDGTKRICTINSLGASAIRNAYGNKTQLDSRKYKNHVDNNIKNGVYAPTKRLEDATFHIYAMNIKSLVDLYRVNLCMKEEELWAVIKKYGIYIVDNEVELVMKTIKWGYHNWQVIDFIDQIWFPVVKKMPLDKFDFIFIDECQDLSTCQRELVMRSLSPIGRFIAVGDPHQAIYGFAGADADSFKALMAMPNTITLPLSVSYRCDRAIIALAQTIVPQIEARENAGEGIVDEEAKLEHIKDGDMVVCRNTAPLVGLCMKYISEGIKAYVVGKDIGANLIKLIKDTRRDNMVEVFDKLAYDLQHLRGKLIEAGVPAEEVEDESTYSNLQDKIGAVHNIAGDENDMSVVINRIATIFKDESKDGICLSTVHKAKGLESDNIFIICNDKFYNPRSMKLPWMAEQEHNLVYVAYTRAKHFIGFIIDFKG